ncbi:MAG TPA: DUF4384 domain-containing protein, partial [Burkholderiaceae bacterium]|nr:DUF4384 domain-containing protein [Burkholderiaceae bacterium]
SSRGDATFQKFGIDFSVPAAAVPGPSPALGALMQLSAIELVGRLAKVPYWSCLGATEDEPGVTAEVRDWYDTMATRPAEIIEYFQAQMRLRRLYDGPIDGTVNPQIKDAVARYREALGQSREAKLSLDFFKAYLAANHKEIAAKIQPASPTPPPTPAPTSTPAPASAPATAVATAAAPVKTAAPAQAVPSAKLALSVATPGNNNHFSRGEKIELSIKPSRDAHVYCFMQDENRKVVRFFPNRFQRDSHVVAATGLSLPGKMRFEMRMNPSGRQETISCFATERDVLADLPSGLGAADFDPLPVADIQQVRDAFVTVTAGAFAQEVLHVQPR